MANSCRYTLITEVKYDGQPNLHGGEHGAFVRWRPLGRREIVDKSVPEGFSHGYRAVIRQMHSACYRNRQGLKQMRHAFIARGSRFACSQSIRPHMCLSLSTRIYDNVRSAVKRELEARTHVPTIYIDVTES